MIVQNLSIEETSLWENFPLNSHINSLLQRCLDMHVSLQTSPVPEQWLYHPAFRTIYIWEPDLKRQPLSYLVVILAHELGHAVDFDNHPEHALQVRDIHWSQAPDHVERAAFVNGFHILKELRIPVSLHDYLLMIDENMGAQVKRALDREMCCLLSPRQRAAVRPEKRRKPRHAPRHSETAMAAVAAPMGERP